MIDTRSVTQGVSQAVLAPPSPHYKPVTSAPCDCGNISHDPTRDSSRDPFATCTSCDLSARDPGNLRPCDPGKITHDLSRNWSSTKSLDQTRFGHASNPLINTWQIMGTINTWQIVGTINTWQIVGTINTWQIVGTINTWQIVGTINTWQIVGTINKMRPLNNQ